MDDNTNYNNENVGKVSRDFDDLITHLNKKVKIIDENKILEFLLHFTEKKKYIFHSNEITFDYPLIFLYLRGHDIEDQIIYMLDSDINDKVKNLKSNMIKEK